MPPKNAFGVSLLQVSIALPETRAQMVKPLVDRSGPAHAPTADPDVEISDDDGAIMTDHLPSQIGGGAGVDLPEGADGNIHHPARPDPIRDVNLHKSGVSAKMAPSPHPEDYSLVSAKSH
jgi:hypothetical protein